MELNVYLQVIVDYIMVQIPEPLKQYLKVTRVEIENMISDVRNEYGEYDLLYSEIEMSYTSAWEEDMTPRDYVELVTPSILTLLETQASHI